MWNTLGKSRPVVSRLMMGTRAFCVTGEDISREESCYCFITSETETDYYGRWVCGLGFINVRFPKWTTRELTESEQEQWLKDKDRLRIGSLQDLGEIR